MAKMTINFPTDLQKAIEKVSDKEEYLATKALEAGASPVEAQIRANLESVIGKGERTESTGQLLSSLGSSPVKTADDGWDIKVGFAESRTDGNRNPEIAAYMEYGTSNGRPARPFISKAKKSTKNTAIQAMSNEWDSQVSKMLKGV